jgi:hypothetical protein
MRPIIALIVPQPLAVLAATMGGLAAERRTATSRPALPAIDRYYCTGGRTWATGEVLRALLYWVEKEPMRLDAEKAATAVMTVAIAGVGPACVALLLLL